MGNTQFFQQSAERLRFGKAGSGTGKVEITAEQSKYRDELYHKHQERVPIGVLDDIEVIFLHYSSFEEAVMAWNRRKQRICIDNLYVKMSEMNNCTKELLILLKICVRI